MYRAPVYRVPLSALSSSVRPISSRIRPRRSLLLLSRQSMQKKNPTTVRIATRFSTSKSMSNESGSNDDDNNNNNNNVLSSHYEAHSKAESYDNAYFYEPGAYMENLLTIVRDRLQLTQPTKAATTILDIGGGTGTFAQALVENDDCSSSRIVVVEPFLDPILAATTNDADDDDDDDDAAVSFVKGSAEDFLVPPTPDSWRTQIIDHHHGGYDQILVKEVVHHFKKEDRVGIFRGMREGLRNNNRNNDTRDNESSTASNAAAATTKRPSLLIITRPQIDIDYPLWEQARKVWRENQPSIEEIEEDLRQAGYTRLERFVEPFECSISLSRWQGMVKSRCWSTFSNFTDDELLDACAVIAEETSKDPKTTKGETDQDTILRFEDRMIFLEAS